MGLLKITFTDNLLVFYRETIWKVEWIKKSIIGLKMIFSLIFNKVSGFRYPRFEKNGRSIPKWNMILTSASNLAAKKANSAAALAAAEISRSDWPQEWLRPIYFNSIKRRDI